MKPPRLDRSIWISVTKELPPIDTVVMVRNTIWAPHEGMLRKNGWLEISLDPDKYNGAGHVTHWARITAKG